MTLDYGAKDDPPESGGGGGEAESSDYDMRLEVQMERFIRAVKGGNAKAAAEAFKAAHEECANAEEPEGDESGMMEE